MKRYLLGALLLCLIATGAQSFWQSRQQVSVSSGAAFVGPGDIKSGALFFYSCARGYNAAYHGKACNICNVADAACADVSVGASGFVTIPLIGGSDCTVVVCTIKTYYDQSGSTNCTTACDVTQATIASRATLVTSALGGLACGAFPGAATAYQNLGYTPTTTQPYTGSFVGKRTSGAGSQMFFGDVGNMGMGFLTTKYGMFAPTNLSSAATADNNFHSFQMTANGASSKIVTDSTTDSGAAGANTFITRINLGQDAFSDRLIGTMCETGLFPGFSAGDDTAMTSNQHGAANGYNF